VSDSAATVDAWIAALLDRHVAPLRRPEFLKAVRALSARYVQRHGDLQERSPLDSAGKRAAFAAFYAPLHFFTVREVVRALASSPSTAEDLAASLSGQAPSNAGPIETLIDLGCGTGVSSAAWALELQHQPRLRGFDVHPWAVAEATWNWRALRLHGHATQADLVRATERLLTQSSRRMPLDRTAVIYGWSLNELTAAERDRLKPFILSLARQGARVLIIEPIARALVPWWDTWAEIITSAGGRADTWKFATRLPSALEELDEAAGFQREGLAARSCALNMPSQPPGAAVAC